MKIRKSKERPGDVVVTVRSADLEGDALWVYETLIGMAEAENRKRKKSGRAAIGYTVKQDEPVQACEGAGAAPKNAQSMRELLEELWEAQRGYYHGLIDKVPNAKLGKLEAPLVALVELVVGK